MFSSSSSSPSSIVTFSSSLPPSSSSLSHENEDKDGLTELELRLPPGYRFSPSDDELIGYYLFNKVMNYSLPNVIKQINIYQFNPEQLAQIYKKREEGQYMYFFTSRERRHENGTRPNRIAGNGFWKATAGNIIIRTKNNKVGYKKTLKYHRGHGKSPIFKTNWIMHEYILDDAPLPVRDSNNLMKLNDYVLCRIYERLLTKSKTEDNALANNGLMPYQYHSTEPELDNNSTLLGNEVGMYDNNSTHEVVNSISDHDRDMLAFYDTLSPIIPDHEFNDMVNDIRAATTTPVPSKEPRHTLPPNSSWGTTRLTSEEPRYILRPNSQQQFTRQQ